MEKAKKKKKKKKGILKSKLLPHPSCAKIPARLSG
jgi:hypothetical protein